MNIKASEEVLVKDKPIPLRLTKAELEENEKIASAAGISKSDVARRAYRLGLPSLKNELSMGAE